MGGLESNNEQGSGMETTAGSRLSAGRPAGISRRALYNPFAAADEKITLSVVYVNNKPLHLVFCTHSGNLFPK
jgi:hypothetical protein